MHSENELHPPAARMSLLEAILQDAESLLGLRMTVHDRSGVFFDAVGRPLLDRWRGSHRRYGPCGYGYCKRCVAHCFQAVNQQAAKAPGPFVHRCWKGFVELAIPLRRHGVHVGTLFAGQWRARGVRVPLRLDRRAADEIRRLPLAVDQQLQKLGTLLEALADGLLARAADLRCLDASDASRQGSIRRFIEGHAARPVGLPDLARALHLSPSRTSHLVSERMGKSFRALLIDERLRRAQALLRSTDLTVAEIGRLSGIEDECYFSRLFRERVRVSPRAYRKQGPVAAPSKTT